MLIDVKFNQMNILRLTFTHLSVSLLSIIQLFKMEAAPQIIQFKVVIIGDCGVGKTTFIKRITEQTNERKYIATQGAETILMTFQTNKGPINLRIWDAVGNTSGGGLRDGFYLGAHTAIIMFDLSSRASYRQVPNWYKDLVRVCDCIPIVLVGNKADVVDRKVKPKHIMFHRKKNLQYYDVSSTANYQCAKPFLYILRKLIGDSTVELWKELAIKPQLNEMDKEYLLILQQEWKVASCQPYPDEDQDL